MGSLVGPIIDAIGPARVLLVLDNAEHVADDVATLVEALLPACSNLRVLVTSQQPIAATGETVWRLGPMNDKDAVELLALRASQSDSTFVVDDDNFKEVHDLCIALDRVPFAIELAAARLRAFSLSELRQLLDDRLSLLAGGPRTALPRHQGLRAALSWTLELCTDDERAVLAVLAVFAGGFDLDAATRVGTDVLDRANVTLAIARLVDLSLIEADTSSGRTRYRLLESVRALALELLDAMGLAEPARRAHLDFMLSLVCPTLPHDGCRFPGWAQEVAREHANLDAALSWSLSGGDIDRGVALIAGSSSYWDHVGRLAEGRAWSERALAVSRTASPRARAYALFAAGWTAYYRSDQEPGRSSLENARAAFEEIGDLEGVARTDYELGDLAADLGELERSRRHAADSNTQYAKLGHRWGIAASEILLGHVATIRGDDDDARLHFDRGLDASQELDDPVLLAECLHYQGQLADRHDDRAERRRCFEASLAYAEAAEDQRWTAAALTHLCALARDERRLDDAAALIDRAIVHARANGDLLTLARVRCDAGIVACWRRDYENAVPLLAQALSLSEHIRANRTAIRALDDIVEHLARVGDLEAAKRLVAETNALRRDFDFARTPAMQQRLGELLGDSVRATRKTTLSDAVADALAALQ
jgi:predicted ATPase